MGALYISDPEFFGNSLLKNPIHADDHRLQKYFPDFYELHYDIRLLATKAASAKERSFWFYNDCCERYGNPDISYFDKVIADKQPKSIFLNGFNQNQFDYIAPKLKDTTEVIYFFKCPKIKDLSALTQFANLQCVHAFWNNSLECLWDMSGNKQLKVISFTYISKLRNVESLIDSTVEYVHFDSIDNSSNRKPILFDPTIFDQMTQIKHLSLLFRGCHIEY